MIMKKVLMFMAIMIAVVSLSSCNSLENMNGYDDVYSYKYSTKNKSYNYKSLTNLKSTNRQYSLNIYDRAKERVRYSYLSDCMDSITNVKVIVSNDSICTISFIHKYLDKPFAPKIMEKKMEYTLFKAHKGYKNERETKYYETILNMENDIDRHNSIEEAIVYINFIGNLYDLAEEPNAYLYDLQEDNLLKKTYDEFIKKGMSKEKARDKCLYVRAMVNLISNRAEEINF